jgi:hypothetical protein
VHLSLFLCTAAALGSTWSLLHGQPLASLGQGAQAMWPFHSFLRKMPWAEEVPEPGMPLRFAH